MKIITLTQGKVALVDDEDFERLSAFKWHYAEDKKSNKGGYAKRVNPGEGPSYLWMHKVILGLSEHEQGDHRDGNKLNNQKYNLRPATHSNNTYNKVMDGRNSSGFKGVSMPKHFKRWRARAVIHGKEYWGGYFYTREAAAKAYDKLAVKLFGEFARTNKSLGLLPDG